MCDRPVSEERGTVARADERADRTGAGTGRCAVRLLDDALQLHGASRTGRRRPSSKDCVNLRPRPRRGDRLRGSRRTTGHLGRASTRPRPPCPRDFRISRTMAKVDYDERLHAVYGAGRQMSLDALANLDGGVRPPPAGDTATGLARPRLPAPRRGPRRRSYSVISLMRSATFWAVGSGACDCIAISFVMSP